MAVRESKRRLSYDDYRYLEKPSREVGSQFPRYESKYVLIPPTAISATPHTVHESYVASFRWYFVKRRRCGTRTPVPESYDDR